MGVDFEKLGITQEEFNSLSEEEQKALLQQQEAPKQQQDGSSHQEPQGQQDDDIERKVKGILSDLQKERAKNRELQEKMTQLQQEYEQTTALLQEIQEKGSAGEGEFTEEDVATLKQVRETVQREIQKIAQPVLESITVLESKFLAISEKEAKQRFSPEKVGEELSYDRVIEEGLKPLLQQNPAYKAVIRASANPAEEAYRIGLTHPKFQEITLRKKQEEILSKLTKQRAKTGVGSAGSGGIAGVSDNVSVSDLLKLSDEELDRLAREKG